MEIFTFIWSQYLYIPLFNLLVWLYVTYSNYNLGVAVIILTILLRFVLLPFTALVERGKIIRSDLDRQVHEIRHDFSNDPVGQKKEIRALLKRRKIKPWAKAVVLGVQFLVLILLYQVFIGGINTVEKLHLLYPHIIRPDFINTKFLWFDIAQRNLVLPAIAAGYLFAEIMIQQYNERRDLSRGEQLYTILFPAFSFLILAILPSVKSVFILTSLIFSSIISAVTALIKFNLEQIRFNKQRAKAK